MSFDTMKVAELKQVAETFGVDVEDSTTKAEVLAALTEEGVTFEMYNSFLGAEKEEVEEVEEPEPVAKKAPKAKAKNTVLVKMERKNPSYQTYGYVFTGDHPYVAIPEDIAQDIFDNESGFRMATPREIQDFYS